MQKSMTLYFMLAYSLEMEKKDWTDSYIEEIYKLKYKPSQLVDEFFFRAHQLSIDYLLSKNNTKLAIQLIEKV